MAERSHPLIKLLQKDRRYTLDAYQFVRDALTYAQEVLQMGGDDEENGGSSGESRCEGEEAVQFHPEGEECHEEAIPEKHVTGQQLCEAIRQYAIDQYGYMARPVLSSWGINATGDFGEIVYNLIGIGLMKKSAGDRREDFDNVYDFEHAFQRAFEITLPD
jgi:uncharacterized repeat protein (TIGR04138 family)